MSEKSESVIAPTEQQAPAGALGLGTGSASFVLDCNGREILPGDTLKVFHFIGARRKRHHMFKYVLSVYRHPNWTADSDALRISHLNPQGESYLLLRKGQQEQNYEIVQGYGPDGHPFDTRKKRKPNTKLTDAPNKGPSPER